MKIRTLKRTVFSELNVKEGTAPQSVVIDKKLTFVSKFKFLINLLIDIDLSIPIQYECSIRPCHKPMADLFKPF